MLRRVSVVLLSAGALALGACNNGPPTPPDTGVSVSCPTTTACNIPQGATESDISSHIASAAAGTTFTFAAGTFPFKNTITVNNAAGLTFKGAGIGQTILEFADQTGGSGGISATLGNAALRFEGFTIQNTLGDGIKVEKATGVVFYQVQVRWLNAADGGPNYLRHGGYGIYPVQSQNVLVDHCDISGARDTGAYIGQSYTIVVSNNTVHDNVAGIEIEASVSADVHDNTSTNNSGGILVFALPNLQPPPDAGFQNDSTHFVRVYNNTVTANNTQNFADPSGSVAQVPAGSGIILLAANYVEVFGNTISNNDTLAVANASYLVLDPTFNPLDMAQNPTALDPFSHSVYVHDNTFSNNGGSPQGTNVYAPDGGPNGVNQLGTLFVFLQELGAWSSAPDIIWDGIAPPPYVPPAVSAGDAGSPPNPLNYFFENNHNANVTGPDWVNVNLPIVYVPPATILVNGLAFAAAPFMVTAPPTGFPLPAVDAGILP
jgi:parallel beta-helix repeat protein